MAIEYYKAKAALDEIAARIQRNNTRMIAAGTQITTAVNDLGDMVADYSTIVTEIDAMAANNPDDGVWQATKAEKDKLVAEFTAEQTAAQAKKAAFDNA